LELVLQLGQGTKKKKRRISPIPDKWPRPWPVPKPWIPKIPHVKGLVFALAIFYVATRRD